MEKVFAADDLSAIAIAGAAGQAIEIVKLFQLELEHYEKITGDRLSLEGKANRLAQMIRGNLPMAIQGLVVVPLFGGFDERREEGRIFYYDATGGRWEEDDYHSTGSGGRPAQELAEEALAAGARSGRRPCRSPWRPWSTPRRRTPRREDPTRPGGSSPTVVVVTSEGAESVGEDELRNTYERVRSEGGS